MGGHAHHRWRALSLGSAALFVGLGIVVFAIGVLPGDSALYDEVMARRTPAIIQFFSWANVFGSWKGLLPAALVLFAISPEARKRWWLVALVLLVAPGFEHTAKVLVGRPRPRGSAMGFPSGHMTAAVAFAVIIFLHIVFGELAPKSLAIQRPEGTALVVAAPMHAFRVLLYRIDPRTPVADLAHHFGINLEVESA